MSTEVPVVLKFVCHSKGGRTYLEIRHFPLILGTLHAIPSRVLKRLAKLTSRNPSIHSEAVDKIYPDHENTLCKLGLAPPISPTIGDLWRKQDEKVDSEKEQDVSKNKNRKVYFCVAY